MITALRLLLPLSLLFGLVCTGTAFADSGKHLSIASHENISPLVELYTSEGCSSCPRADNFLTDLGESLGNKFHAVLLAFHVDYWNWLGWQDPFSKPDYSDRQRRVANFNHQNSVYTPEITVAGKERRGGLKIIESIERSNAEKSLVEIMLDLTAKTDNLLDAAITINNMTESRHIEAYVAIYENNIKRQIGGGENKGKTLIHNYVVRHWSEPIQVDSTDLIKTVSLELEQDWNVENLGIAVVVVDTTIGETLQALTTPIAQLYLKTE